MAESKNAKSAVDKSSELEMRIAAIESEMQAMKKALYTIPIAMEEDKVKLEQNQKEFENLQTTVRNITISGQETGAAVNNLQKRVDVVKKESTSGVVLSIIVFSILLIISIFIRSA
ncbi:MAG: hypothetical protein HQL69_15945 [Magnetococcales bacterium]|nr:hypothetical protein [Magnetococcales bacterium]